MKNKKIIVGAVILLIVLIAVGFYLLGRNSSNGAASKNSQIQENAQAGQIQENSNGSQNGLKIPQDKIITDDFTIDLPKGWEQLPAPMGASAMAVNTNEIVSDPAAQKINFKSYFAVSYDTLAENTADEYIQTVKSQLAQAAPEAVFGNEKEITINGKPARSFETDMSQRGADFKVLIVIVFAENKDIWVITFNTVKSDWNKNKELFDAIGASFTLKK